MQVKIESMAYKGYAVTRTDGKVLFIPYSAAGDSAWVEIVEEKRGYSIGRLIELIVPSPWRTDPPCPYFRVCGGCQWQHIDYSAQGELKKGILKEVLNRLGHLEEVPPITVALSPSPYGYRVRCQFKAKGNIIGYYKERSHHIVDIDHCPISHLLINRIIPLLRQELSSFSKVEEIEINVSPEEGKGILILHSLSYSKGLEDLLRGLLLDHPVLKGAAILERSKGRKEQKLLGDPCLFFTIFLNQNEEKRTVRLRTSPGSFSQVNLDQNQTLVQTVLQLSELKIEDRVLDLYSGIGNFTLPLAIHVREVTGVEDNKVAVEDSRFNAEKNGIKNCKLLLGRVEEVLEKGVGPRPDLVLLDPPRTGCKMIIDRVAGLKPERIVYASCEPTTLARDLHLFLERGYCIQKLFLIDMFPQSYHMEVVALLK